MIFVSIVSMWGFFGVEWFVGPSISNQPPAPGNTCKNDSSMITPDTDTDIVIKKNSRNINYLYIAISLIFMSIIISIIITFLALRN